MESPTPNRNNQRADMLAFLAIFGLVMTILLLVTAGDIAAGNRDILLVLIGALISMAKDVYSFEFGSSKGYERSNQALAASASNGKSHTP